MRTTFRIRQPYSTIFLECAKNTPCVNRIRPRRFIEKMKSNKGIIGKLSGMELDEQGLERKNPVIVALGDSVTAGHFESLLLTDANLATKVTFARKNRDWSDKTLQAALWKGPATNFDYGYPPLEITDAREAYVEKFRHKLIEQYEATSVSVINAGIAGDNLYQMMKRVDRDVIRYQPDLILVNAALNWSEELGTSQDYKELLRTLILKMKQKTDTDIVLLTPNGDLPDPFTPQMLATKTAERVETIRQLAEEEQVSLVDVYLIWEKARLQGCPWEELLANKINHPSVEGHEVYALALMKLFEE